MIEETPWCWFAGSEITPEFARDAFRGWEVTFLVDRGAQTGAVFNLGQEVHAIVAPEWRRRALRRDNVRSLLAGLLKRYGVLTTRLLHESKPAADFITRIGFEKTWSDESFDYYALYEAPFQRRPA